ncbi:YdhK family protein [Ruoffia tabacinasalis]|nr:YdhK family protein [Ruoffia tabacinasalis]
MKKYISKSAMVLSAVLLFGASSATSLNGVFAQDSVDEISESVGDTVDDAASDISDAVTGEESESTTEEPGEMTHDDEGRLPGNIKIEREPTYKVGDDVQINATHMPGMEGAQGTVVAAFDTTAYEISYTPTDDSEPVENHRWIVQEEIAEAADQEDVDAPFEVGAEVTVEAYHMPGMEGATATIDAVNETTVYLVDYIDTESGEEVINHKWVTEDELATLDSSEETAPATSESAPESSEDESGSEESSSDEESGSESESTPEESSDEESSSEEESSEESTPEESGSEESSSEGTE